MAKYWMISNRDVRDDCLGSDHAGVTYWMTDTAPLNEFRNWGNPVSAERFKNALTATANRFPLILDPNRHEEQKHVALFIHGYNTDWADSAGRYQKICDSLFGDSDDGLGLCILFTWPSDGMSVSYLPDRADARRSAGDLADVLCEFYDWLLDKQIAGAEDPKKSCRAKTSIIAHSMGNYVLQNAMQTAWTRKNQPLLVSLINQLVMVAADVDNDLFKSGEAIEKGDGDAIANLTYRVTALYSGRDPVLGLSAGLKHFGKRRLGRSGLDRTYEVPDNVWDVDCSTLFRPDQDNIHSAYFEEQRTIDLMRQLLLGTDRGVLTASGAAPG
jgi:esterase/lipase superfamily enzyme